MVLQADAARNEAHDPNRPDISPSRIFRKTGAKRHSGRHSGRGAIRVRALYSVFASCHRDKLGSVESYFTCRVIAASPEFRRFEMQNAEL